MTNQNIIKEPSKPFCGECDHYHNPEEAHGTCEMLHGKKPNRVEIINHSKYGTGRDYVMWKEGIEAEVMYQDEGRTIKVFIRDKQRK